MGGREGGRKGGEGYWGARERGRGYSPQCETSIKKGIRSGLFSAASHNGDLYYDVGPLCPI